MLQPADTHDSRFRAALPARFIPPQAVCAVCGKGLVASWNTDTHRACVCPDCLTRVYQRALTGH